MTSRLACPLLAAGLAAAWALPCAAQGMSDEERAAGTLMRWFTDSDHISVRSMSGDWAWPLRNASGLNFHFNN